MPVPPSLGAACMDICKWPSPTIPGTYELPLLNKMVTICVPDAEAMHQVSPDLSVRCSLPEPYVCVIRVV